MKFLRAVLLAFFVFVVGVTQVHAGTIDPQNEGNWKALFENVSLAPNPTLNFGKFTTQSAYNITVEDTELRGFAWGEGVGWIVVNCADTTSGCSGTNSNFKVANDGAGNLSGYAWGQNTGWINFGPFTNPSIPTVKITNGLFGGPSGSSTPGYAWVQNYGWLKFDCSSPNSCVETDWGVVTPPAPSCSDGVQNQNETGVDSGGVCGGGPTGGTPQCRDGFDNNDPEDALADINDPGCHSDGDANNPASYVPNDNDERDVAPSCFDNIQNQNETGVDIGGVCERTEIATCDDRIQNQNETGVDTGGVCGGGTNPPTPSCRDGVRNQDETAVDYGGVCGSSNPPGPTCRDGVQNQGETGIDTGGPCTSTPPNDDFCTLNPRAPECFCVRYPYLCFNPGPEDPGDPVTPIIPTGGGNPIIRWLTWAGLSLPIASGIVSFVVANPIALKEIPLLGVQLWNSLLIALGWKQRKKPWGVVYDSVTKHPIDPAYVVLMDMAGNEVATAITDMNGRYGFAVDPGTYKIVVNKTNYQFPSTKLAGKTDDGLYDELYFGGDVVVSKEGEIITKNIPLDALAFDWNEYTKTHGGTYGMKLAFYRTSDIVLYHISRILFMVGFAYSVYVFVFYPIVFNAIVLALYIIMALVQMFAPGFHKKGSVLSKDSKKPLPFSVVRIISAVTGKEVAHKVTDRVGNYYGLVQNGLYTFTVDTKKSVEEGYDKHPVDKYVKVKKGYLKETFKI